MRRAIILLAALVACKGKAPADAGPADLATKDTSPAKAPPALRVPHPPVPALPDLPSLASHEPAAALPAGVKLDSAARHCRSVWNGFGVTAESCSKSTLFSSQVDGALPLVSWKALHADPASLPAVVDHRLEATEGSVRDQGPVPACTAFAEAAAIDHAVGRWTGKPSHVSVMQIWSRYHTATEENALAANLTQPVAKEEDWPFVANEANSWLACEQVDETMKKKYGCGQPVTPAHAAKANGDPIAKLTRVRLLKSADASVIRQTVAAGQDVIVAMHVPDTFVPKGKAGARYIPHYASVANDEVGHAMLIAGYVTFANGVYFLLHNSWGASWGDGGYAWIHEATIAKWAHEAVVLDAEPQVLDAKQRPIRARGETTCDGDFVPDSITGTCTPKCPDGSPRHDGVCAAAKNPCPASFVNLTGACVLAAPTSTGTDSDSGVSWACGPGGCSYVLPKSADPTCSGNTCKASCPAPDYRIAKEGSALVCIE
jgi:hypothetical protein